MVLDLVNSLGNYKRNEVRENCAQGYYNEPDKECLSVSFEIRYESFEIGHECKFNAKKKMLLCQNRILKNAGKAKPL